MDRQRPTHITLRTPGIYIASACVEFASNATGQRLLIILDTLSNSFIAVEERNAVNGDTTVMTITTPPYYVTAQTQWQLFVYQDSGAALNVDASPAYSPEFGVTLIG